MYLGVTPDERLGDVIPFLGRVFHSPPGAPILDQRLFDWKFESPHPLWPGRRSFVLEHQGAIAAHGGVIPIHYRGSAGPFRSMQVIDWAGDNSVPGAGLHVYRTCLAKTDTMLAIGGSEAALSVIPRMKMFRRLTDCPVYARPLRPMGVALDTKPLTWRAAAKWGRAWKWKLAPLPANGDWSLRRETSFKRCSNHDLAEATIDRTPEWLNYLLGCPVVEMMAFTVLRNGEVAGHLLASIAGRSRQARLVDVVVDSKDDQDWIQAVSAAIRWLQRETKASEVIAASTVGFLQRVFEACGMHQRRLWPVFLADPKKKFPEGATLEANLLVGDGGFIHDDSVPLLLC